MRHDELIRRLGGDAYVAERLGRDRSSITRWRQRGIPHFAYPAIIALAGELGIALTFEQLAAANPLFGRRGTNKLRRSIKLKRTEEGERHYGSKSGRSPFP